MNILIVGGTGVLSSAVAKEAIHQGFSVTMINRGTRNIANGAQLIRTDKNNVAYIESQLDGKIYDSVIDFLCYTDEATRNSVNLYSKYTKQYFFISTCAVYDSKQLNGQEANEESPKPLNLWNYSINKWESERLLMSLLKGTDTKYTIIRPCVTYDDTRIPYGITPRYGYHWTLIARILSGKPIITWNQGENRCNMMRVEDFAVAVVGLIGNPGAYNEAFNICGDEAPTYKEVLECVENEIDMKAITVDIPSDFYAKEVPARKGEILGGRSIDSINSNAKVKNAVPNFRQNITLQEGVAMTIKAYQLNNYQKGIDWQFDAETDRIIDKWRRLNNPQYKRTMHFVDYLNNATFKDKIVYWINYNNEKISSKCLSRIIVVFQILSRIKTRLFLMIKH